MKWNIPVNLLNMIMFSFSGIWNKNATTSKIFHFLEYGIFWNIPKKSYHHQSSTLIYQFILSKILFLTFYGIWNIPKFCLNMIFFQFFGIWNIPKTNGNKENIEIGGIWNIRGIFLKNSKIIKISKILGIWINRRNIPGIFQKL